MTHWLSMTNINWPTGVADCIEVQDIKSLHHHIHHHVRGDKARLLFTFHALQLYVDRNTASLTGETGGAQANQQT